MCSWFKKLFGGKKCCDHSENKPMEGSKMTPEATPEMPETTVSETNYGDEPKTE